MRVRTGWRAGRLLATAGRRNAVASLVINGGQRLARIVALVPAASVLDPVEFAVLAVGLALTDIARTALLGFDVSAVRTLAGADGARLSPDAERAALADHVVGKLVGGVVIGLATTAIALPLFGTVVAGVVVIGTVGQVFAGVGGLLMVERQTRLELDRVARVAVVAAVVGTAASIGGTLATHSAMAFMAGAALGDLVLWLGVSRGRRTLRGGSRRGIAAVTRHVPALIAIQLAHIGQFRAGTLVLGLVGAPLAVGEYTVASRVAEGFAIVAAALTSSSYPLMIRALGSTDEGEVVRVLRRAYGAGLVLAAAVIAVLSVGVPLWLPLVFPRYPGAAAPFVIVGLAIVVFVANSQTGAWLNAARRDAVATASSVIGLGLNLAASLALAPLGAAGVAVARLAGELGRLGVESAAIGRRRAAALPVMAAWWAVVAPMLAAASMTTLLGTPPWLTGLLLLLTGAGVLAFGRRMGATAWS